MIGLVFAFFLGFGAVFFCKLPYRLLFAVRDGYRARRIPRLKTAPSLKAHPTLFRFLRHLLDFFASLSVFLTFTVFDCAYLKGEMRFPHILSAVFGAVIAGKLARILRVGLFFSVLTLPLDFILYLVYALSLPLLLLFRFFRAVFCKTLLIWKRKYDKIVLRKASVAYTRRLLKQAERAFLPDLQMTER